ncbi:type II toxin-antitoxin system PemK/MazF family toxin [Variovorax sp. RHLX14]|uniref:type II toxin-antitoxin system PemK/MazF family toxin n=1 Tax=Variovorax sp. RHLX14 TaxID=1259731 RepID=UPI003F48C0F0
MTIAEALYKRGDVYWTELDPVRGHEQSKTRPCAILSDTLINQRRGTVVVVPLTTTPQRALPPILVATPSMGAEAKARTEHIRSVDKSRLKESLGRLSEEDLASLGLAVARILKLA